MISRDALIALTPRRASVRLVIALVVAVLSAALAGIGYGPAVAVLAGWNVGGLVLLLFVWVPINLCDCIQTQERAASEDPGRRAVYVMVTASSFISLFAATYLSRKTHSIAPNEARELAALCLTTVALSWTLTHTSFTLRYAHLYYRADDEGVGGAEFAGGARPTYADFAYLSFTVGMCFQVSDVTITSPQMRSTVLLHAVLSFAYNTAIIAFALSLAFGAN